MLFSKSAEFDTLPAATSAADTITPMSSSSKKYFTSKVRSTATSFSFFSDVDVAGLATLALLKPSPCREGAHLLPATATPITSPLAFVIGTISTDESLSTPHPSTSISSRLSNWSSAGIAFFFASLPCPLLPLSDVSTCIDTDFLLFFSPFCFSRRMSSWAVMGLPASNTRPHSPLPHLYRTSLPSSGSLEPALPTSSPVFESNT
mmetsp:Transcript_25516/g.63888  ORF Transcript_25516/g.63888 Transcript_25516/m.63888 type:complete len:205 (-) Transcript_25516:712-1326(-)